MRKKKKRVFVFFFLMVKSMASPPSPPSRRRRSPPSNFLFICIFCFCVSGRTKSRSNFVVRIPQSWGFCCLFVVVFAREREREKKKKKKKKIDSVSSKKVQNGFYLNKEKKKKKKDCQLPNLDPGMLQYLATRCNAWHVVISALERRVFSAQDPQYFNQLQIK